MAVEPDSRSTTHMMASWDQPSGTVCLQTTLTTEWHHWESQFPANSGSGHFDTVAVAGLDVGHPGGQNQAFRITLTDPTTGKITDYEDVVIIRHSVKWMPSRRSTATPHRLLSVSNRKSMR